MSLASIKKSSENLLYMMIFLVIICNFGKTSKDSGNGCSNSLSSSQNIALRSRDYVIIKGGFTVPVGTQLYIDCNNPCY